MATKTETRIWSRKVRWTVTVRSGKTHIGHKHLESMERPGFALCGRAIPPHARPCSGVINSCPDCKQIAKDGGDPV